ncbi:FeoB-associated Cys-rich membrane protein [Oscillospiraceae bacterium CM]|nr:FeoB-associated Cys-rich membrane protein [Oscillospiraceae bacterium CM]
MFSFIAENLATILVGTCVLAVFTAVVIKLIRDKRQHKSSCSGCSGCSCAGDSVCGRNHH